MADDNEKAVSEESKSPVTRAEFEAGIVRKAWDNPEFRKRLLADPRKVVEEELARLQPGAKLPENLQIYVHEEAPDALHLTLPVNPREYADLSGGEWMDEINGGVGGIAVTVVLIYAAAVAMQAAVSVNVAGNMNVAANVNTAGNVNVAGNVNATVNVTA